MNNAFASYHAAVATVFFASALVFTMASMNPACVGMAFVGSLACSVVLRGWHATAGTLRWLLPLWLVVACINSLYSSSQAGTVMSLGPLTFGLESLCYGTTAGAMISAVVLWFACAGECITGDSAVGIVAAAMPTVALMISQVLRLVPQMLRRGRDVLDVQESCRAGTESRTEGLCNRARVVSVLVGWSMEDGAIRAQSMRARGFGRPGVRTRYRRRRFRASDFAMAVAIGLVGLAACVAAGFVGSQFQYYPAIDAQGSWWACIPGLVLVVIPLLLALKGRLVWR